jgi:AAA domain, putative AbiEii toxin, Type IV TA system
VTELDAAKGTIESHVKTLGNEREAIETQLNSIAEKSGQGDFTSALSRRKELTEKLAKVSSYEKGIQEKQDELEKLLRTRWSQIVPALESVQKRVYEARLNKAKAIGAKLSELKAAEGVSVRIEYLGDKEAFSKALGYRDKQKYEGLFKGIDKQYLSKDYPGFYGRKFSPHEFVHFFFQDVSFCGSLAIRYVRRRGEDAGEIVRLVEGTVKQEGFDLIERRADDSVVDRWPVGEFESVTMEDAQKVWKHLAPCCYDGEINIYYDPQKLENLLELELCDIEDRPRIMLDGRPIEELSPGQRCSALIPIILVEGQAPLIIDQPEDNLDNKMVFDLVVDILRGLKEQRQIIVATHNPNIPVSGDAEQVVVFDAPSKEQCHVIAQGSIDDETIVKHIKAVMEGGDKAFQVRMRKYGLVRNA